MPGVMPLPSVVDMRNPRSTIFLAGFVSGLLLVIAANLISYYRMKAEPLLIDAATGFGLPFRLFAISGFGGGVILWGGLIANILLALCVGAALGWIAVKLYGGSPAA